MESFAQIKSFAAFATSLSYLIVPVIFLAVGAVILVSRKDLFGEFIAGAKDGLATGIKLLPTLVALLAAVNMLNASGATELVASALTPLCARFGIPAEIVPFLVVRPVSGGASTAMITDLFNKYGPDSFAGRCASVIMGSSDTIIYIIAVYFSSVSIKRTRGTVPAAFMTMLFGVFFSCLITRLFF
jgi:spore maturation protein B